MDKCLIFPVGTAPAAQFAADHLMQSGVPIADHPTPEITHLLLDVPSFDSRGQLRSGADIDTLLDRLPQKICIIGGNLKHPALTDYRTIDLLNDWDYLADNAAITADCALQVAAPLLKTTLYQSPTLIIGWGRIGKCLARLLQSVGTDVTVAARKQSDRAVLHALGYKAVDTANFQNLSGYRLIFNTVPEPVLNEKQSELCRNCVKIDLASTPGIIGDDVVYARGLPGIYAPETSGTLIAKTSMKYLKEES